jgi:DNA-directed RNA polymerase II subunit RPB2
MEPQENQEDTSVGMNEFNGPPVEVVKEGAVEETPPAAPFIPANTIVQQEPAQAFVSDAPPADAPAPPPAALPEPGPVEVVALDHFDQPFNGTQARSLAAHLIHTYFTSQLTPLTQHHVESYDQFLQRDLRAIIASHNPILIYKNPKARSEDKSFKYKVEIFIGGEQGNEISVCTPTVMLQEGEDVRLMYPNEARLRNLTYAVQVEAKVLIRTHITLDQPPTPEATSNVVSTDIVIDKIPLCNIPLMIHSRYCMLHGKSKAMLTQMGECPQDQGGYFIIDGSEKVLVTRQEAAFNTLWISEKLNDPKNPHVYFQGAIASINPKTRQVNPVMFYYTRDITRKNFMTGDIIQKASVLEVSIPQVLKPIPVFVLFRALGIQSDKDILQTIFPDLDSPETKYLNDLLHASIIAAQPFPDSYSAVQYIKSLTKGFSEFHVLDILHTQLFPHVADVPGAKVLFLADCVRKMLRVIKKVELPASRDDTRYQRLQTSGFLCQKMFLNLYKAYVKSIKRTIDDRYAYNESMYSNMDFLKIFGESNRREIFQYGFLTQGIMRAFKGKWMTGPNKEESGVIQEMSRLSYLDFMSHTRRIVLEFDESIKLPGPRRLHPSQYGYFCTSETPSGAHIGITKNFSIMTAVSTGVYPDQFTNWLYERGSVVKCEFITPQLAAYMIPVYVNAGIVGYTAKPTELARVLRFMKRSGFLPPLSSSGFSIPERRVFVFMDDGRPLRPLVICEPRGLLPARERFQRRSWREYVVGSLRPHVGIGSREFADPLESEPNASLSSYILFFEQRMDQIGLIEYIDPYEQNEVLIASYPEHIGKETTHMEVHPSTVMGLLGNMIPYPNHNQSPRNQLSASQSKQGLSLYATNWTNRFDNTANVLCYGEAPLSRTIYQDYIGDGRMSYGQNIILAMGVYGGYNQEDGIIMNADALARGQFRSINYRSYEAFEEDDEVAHMKTRIGNPSQIPGWTELNPRYDYTKLDDNGFIREGEYVDQNTVIVGRYMQGEKGVMKDASMTPQVWTSGRVEKVVVVVNNLGLRLVKVRIVKDRVPELGDKFCLTPDHEVCTKNRGWVPIADITTDDYVAQLNKEKQSIEYVKPNETYVFEHTGQMYEVITQGVNLCTTLNHRMWVQKRNSKSYELIEAKDMMGKRVRFSSYSPSSNKEYMAHIGEHKFTSEQMNAFLTLCGIWIAEGWVYHSEKDYIHRLEICANKPSVYEALKNVSETLQLKTNYVESTNKFYINSKEYVAFFTPLSVGAINKQLPEWYVDLSKEQSALLMAALCMGDGHETLTSLHYGTSSIQLRDQIQILAQHAGYTSTYRKLMEKGQINIGKDGTQFKANADHWGIYIRRKRVNPTLNHGHVHTQDGQTERLIEYDGNVYCLSVPSEVFLVRRNGTITWTGNSNRHGQKGTINVLYRGHDMPRTADGIVPDMIMNPTALPSRMTIGQILEMIMGQAAASIGAIGNVTAFMNDGSPHEALGAILEKLGMNKMCNQILYNGMTGEQMTADIFMGIVYGMRLKHMTEDKWNARGEGRREQRTHQPTGGRGNEGGMKLGEMERDAILAHGIASFQNESYMKRSDGSSFFICNGCGTIPIYNERQGLYLCSLCDGPIQFSGDTSSTLDPIPPNKRSATTFSKVEMPYATKLFDQEMATFTNMSTRYLTTRDTMRLNGLDVVEELAEVNATGINQTLQPIVYPSHHVPELVKQVALPTAGDIQRTLATLNDEARNVYQAEVASVMPPPAPNAQEVQLAPNSFGPPVPAQPAQPAVVIPVAQAINGEGVIATADNGAPIINIDTSERALQAEGLTIPSDATRSLQPPGPQGQMGGQWGPPPIRRQRRSPSQPRYQQQPHQQPYQQDSWGPPPEQQMGGGGGRYEEPNEEAPQEYKSSGPLKVIKMG